ncbi:hypothetical protein H6P81_014304 [Aristolochia fimbriata]|uniref:Uncharacterized protein n=1 Tax=Aristolochia fimbriata TaxID=158543 RepID=A0AAV7EIA7_ARIFI|nr:hypothetical protein H6P81_014304 [Aristolochia fimbriata]
MRNKGSLPLRRLRLRLRGEVRDGGADPNLLAFFRPGGALTRVAGPQRRFRKRENRLWKRWSRKGDGGEGWVPRVILLFVLHSDFGSSRIGPTECASTCHPGSHERLLVLERGCSRALSAWWWRGGGRRGWTEGPRPSAGTSRDPCLEVTHSARARGRETGQSEAGLDKRGFIMSGRDRGTGTGSEGGSMGSGGVGTSGMYAARIAVKGKWNPPLFSKKWGHMPQPDMPASHEAGGGRKDEKAKARGTGLRECPFLFPGRRVDPAGSFPLKSSRSKSPMKPSSHLCPEGYRGNFDLGL